MKTRNELVKVGFEFSSTLLDGSPVRIAGYSGCQRVIAYIEYPKQVPNFFEYWRERLRMKWSRKPPSVFFPNRDLIHGILRSTPNGLKLVSLADRVWDLTSNVKIKDRYTNCVYHTQVSTISPQEKTLFDGSPTILLSQLDLWIKDVLSEPNKEI